MLSFRLIIFVYKVLSEKVFEQFVENGLCSWKSPFMLSIWTIWYIMTFCQQMVYVPGSVLLCWVYEPCDILWHVANKWFMFLEVSFYVEYMNHVIYYDMLPTNGLCSWKSPFMLSIWTMWYIMTCCQQIVYIPGSLLSCWVYEPCDILWHVANKWFIFLKVSFHVEYMNHVIYYDMLPTNGLCSWKSPFMLSIWTMWYIMTCCQQMVYIPKSLLSWWVYEPSHVIYYDMLPTNGLCSWKSPFMLSIWTMWYIMTCCQQMVYVPGSLLSCWVYEPCDILWHVANKWFMFLEVSFHVEYMNHVIYYDMLPTNDS